MGNLAAASWAVSVTDQWISHGKRHVEGTLVLANTADVYPNNGIPLPVLGKLGFVRQVDYFAITGIQGARKEAAPVTPVATLVVDATVSQVPAAGHKYKATFVTADGESLPSAASVAVTNDGTHTQNSIARPSGYTLRVTGWNLYRAEGAGYTTYSLVNPSPTAIATTPYLDIVTNANLGAAAPTLDSTSADYVFRYDKTNHKLFLFVEEATAAGGPMLEASTAEVPGPETYTYYAIGW
jgi:hypothetical protein